jgi:hypothetical protein
MRTVKEIVGATDGREWPESHLDPKKFATIGRSYTLPAMEIIVEFF